jgi:hypothetical protein
MSGRRKMPHSFDQGQERAHRYPSVTGRDHKPGQASSSRDLRDPPPAMARAHPPRALHRGGVDRSAYGIFIEPKSIEVTHHTPGRQRAAPPAHRPQSAISHPRLRPPRAEPGGAAAQARPGRHRHHRRHGRQGQARAGPRSVPQPLGAAGGVERARQLGALDPARGRCAPSTSRWAPVSSTTTASALRDDVWIAGLDDPATGHPDITRAMAGAPAPSFKLVLMHGNPTTSRRSPASSTWPWPATPTAGRCGCPATVRSGCQRAGSASSRLVHREPRATSSSVGASAPRCCRCA